MTCAPDARIQESKLRRPARRERRPRNPPQLPDKCHELAQVLAIRESVELAQEPVPDLIEKPGFRGGSSTAASEDDPRLKQTRPLSVAPQQLMVGVVCGVLVQLVWVAVMVKV